MQKWTNKVPLDQENIYLEQLFTEDTLFFDIETTGFSPANTEVYLIGCASRNGNSIQIDQYFSECPEDEFVILKHFLKFMKSFQTIITFNGIGFDIPYIKAKCDSYGLKEDFSSKDYIDLFKIVSSMKFLLKLPSYKQKSLETFLGIDRNDTFSGGELINVYKEYVSMPTEYQMFFLKQHNYEDVLGMLNLLPVLSYRNFLEGGYSITEVYSNTYTDFEGHLQKELVFSLENDVELPKAVSYRYENCYLTCHSKISKLSIQLCEDELKFFFKDYKDYYYLPAEDTAIHKDVASFVEKEFRKKATASTCYTKKTSIFLPQYQPVMEPAFFKNHKDKVSYFELTEEFINSNTMLRQYVEHIICLMAKQKK